MDSTETDDLRERALEFLAWMSQVLDEAGLDAVVIGGQARNFWAEPRMTRDYDFTTDSSLEGFGRLREALLARGFRVVRDQAGTGSSGPDFMQFANDETGEMIDLQAAKTEFQAEIVRRGVQLDPAQRWRVATPEDVIVLKLIANRTKDHHDLYELGRIEGLDWDYVAHWAGIWAVSDRLAALQLALEHDRKRIEELYR